MLKTGTRNGR